MTRGLPDTGYIDDLYLDTDGTTDFSGALHRDLDARVDEFGGHSRVVLDDEEMTVWLARRLLAGPAHWELAPLVLVLRIMSSMRDRFGPPAIALCHRALTSVDTSPLSRACPHDGIGHPRDNHEEGWASAIEAIAYGEAGWPPLEEWQEERAAALEDGEDPEEFEEYWPRPTVAGWDCPKYVAEMATTVAGWFEQYLPVDRSEVGGRAPAGPQVPWPGHATEGCLNRAVDALPGDCRTDRGDRMVSRPRA
ncbi:hypothetical protein ACWCP6_10160 [Streptomyces sp. NPDC002004]